MDKPKEKTREVLSTAGLRTTNQRSLILDIIRHGQGHLDADEVFRLARLQQPRLSLSTVYRTLSRLKELGLVEEHHFDDTHHHYEIKSPTEHHHLVCKSCGRVIEFEYPLARTIMKGIPEAKGFEITDSEVQIMGYCPECRKNIDNSVTRKDRK
ncbi:Fur family transcriptional regulator [Chloroflexota bacterium]